MKLGLPDRGVPRALARAGRRVGRRGGLRGARGRVLAGGRRRAAPLRRRDATSTSTRSTRDDVRARPRPPRARRSPRSPTTRTTSTPTTPTARRSNGHLRKVIDAAQRLGVEHRRHLRRQRQGPAAAREPRALPRDLAAARRLRGRARRQDRDRELPDDLLLRRVARRQQPRLVARRSGTSCSTRSRPPTSGSTSTRRTSSGCMIDYERAVYDYADRIFHVAREGPRDPPRRASTGTARSRGGIGWQVPRLPGSARCAGTASSPRSTRSATTTWSRSSTRTAASRATRSSSSAASCSRARLPLRPYDRLNGPRAGAWHRTWLASQGRGRT